MRNRVVICISGASGMPYAVRILEYILENTDLELHVVSSRNAEAIMLHETGKTLNNICSTRAKIWDNDAISAPLASGTWRFQAMAIVPCSTSTLCKIANGIGDNLITRLGAIALKEKRMLVIVPRETPLSPPVLEAMYKLSTYGVNIIVPAPPFYNKPKSISDMVDYIAGKVLDAIGIENTLYGTWQGFDNQD